MLKVSIVEREQKILLMMFKAIKTDIRAELITVPTEVADLEKKADHGGNKIC